MLLHFSLVHGATSVFLYVYDLRKVCVLACIDRPATLAGLNGPQAVAADGAGGVWVADTNNSAVRRVFANGTIMTWAGNGTPTYCGDGGPARAACFSNPTGIASDGAGGLLIADTGNAVVRRISAGGTVTCVAGTPLVRTYTGDGGPATLATAGAVRGELARRVSAGGGDLATMRRCASASCRIPPGVADDGSGGFAFTDGTYLVVRYVTSAGVISTIAGTGLGVTGTVGNGGPVCVEGGPNADTEPQSHAPSTPPTPPPRPDSSAARLNSPYSIVGDAAGSLLVADRGNHAIRRLYPGNLSFAAATFAGVMGASGATGDRGPASAARLYNPSGMASDGSGGWLIVR